MLTFILSLSLFLSTGVDSRIVPFRKTSKAVGQTFSVYTNKDGSKVKNITVTHSWLTRKTMSVPRSDMTATTAGDFVFLIGGCTANQVLGSYGYECPQITAATTKYDPINDKFYTLANAPRARYRHAAVVHNGKIYVYGGCSVTDAIIQEVDVYNIADNVWTTLPDLFLNATSDNMGFIVGSTIYSAGGYARPWSMNEVTRSDVYAMDLNSAPLT
eukprot:g1832.t1